MFKMKLKHINHGLKCPICKKFGLKPLNTYQESGGYGSWFNREGKGHLEIKGYGGIIRNIFNFYRCNYCYGEFVEDLK